MLRLRRFAFRTLLLSCALSACVESSSAQKAAKAFYRPADKFPKEVRGVKLIGKFVVDETSLSSRPRYYLQGDDERGERSKGRWFYPSNWRLGPGQRYEFKEAYPLVIEEKLEWGGEYKVRFPDNYPQEEVANEQRRIANEAQARWDRMVFLRPSADFPEDPARVALVGYFIGRLLVTGSVYLVADESRGEKDVGRYFVPENFRVGQGQRLVFTRERPLVVTGRNVGLNFGLGAYSVQVEMPVAKQESSSSKQAPAGLELVFGPDGQLRGIAVAGNEEAAAFFRQNYAGSNAVVNRHSLRIVPTELLKLFIRWFYHSAKGKFVDGFRPKPLSSDQPLGGFNDLPWGAEYADVLFASEIGAKGNVDAVRKMFDIDEQYRLAKKQKKRIYFAQDEPRGIQGAATEAPEPQSSSEEIAALNSNALDISQRRMLDNLNSQKELTETGLRFLPNLGVILGDGPDRSVEYLFSDGRLYAVILRGKGYGGPDRRSAHLETQAYYDALVAKYGSPDQRNVPKGGGFLTYCTWKNAEGTLVMVVEPGSGEGASSDGDGSLTGRTLFIVTYSNEVLAGADERMNTFKAQAEQNAAVAEQSKTKYRQHKSSELIDRL